MNYWTVIISDFETCRVENKRALFFFFEEYEGRELEEGANSREDNENLTTLNIVAQRWSFQKLKQRCFLLRQEEILDTLLLRGTCYQACRFVSLRKLSRNSIKA